VNRPRSFSQFFVEPRSLSWMGFAEGSSLLEIGASQTKECTLPLYEHVPFISRQDLSNTQAEGLIELILAQFWLQRRHPSLILCPHTWAVEDECPNMRQQINLHGSHLCAATPLRDLRTGSSSGPCLQDWSA